MVEIMEQNMLESICAYCEKPFKHTKLRQKCCSKKCRQSVWYRAHKEYIKEYNKRYHEARK
jgi:hypothetical protein